MLGVYSLSPPVKILVIGALLLIFGIFSIYSVSIFESFGLTLDLVDLWLRTNPSNYYYFFEQLMKLSVGLVLATVLYFLPLRVFFKWKYVFFGLSIIGVLLLFTPLGIELNGSRAWLSLPGWTVQPGEFFKLGFVLFVSDWLVRKKKELDELQYYLWFLIITWILYLIFLFIPDLGTIFVLVSVALIIFWYAGGRWYYIVATLLLGIIGSIMAASQFGYIERRFSYFFNPDADADGRGVGRQTKQALISVWWWGRIGKWYGKGLQKFGYIPEAQSDFIFAAFSEEIGFLWDVVLLMLYFALAYTVLQKLWRVKDPYERTVAVGLLSMIFMQMFINIGVNIKIIPLTWLTLPFISHGGSALIVNMIEVVLLYKIVEQK